MVANAQAALMPFGGRLLVDSDRPAIVDGSACLLVIVFDSLEEARTWQES